MSGLPASGKSTEAKAILKQGGNWVRLNRDLLRKMLHFDVWSPNNEGLTIDAIKRLARMYLTEGTSVVIDDTNLGDKHRQSWSGIAQECDAKFEVRTMDTGIDECIERDEKRENGVGKHVIVQMALQYGLYPKPEKPFVLCDIDGTIADCSHRLHFVNGDTKDWKSFFEAMGDDGPRIEVIDELMEYKSKGHEIIFVTARPEDYRKMTEAWIERAFNGYTPHQTIIMRRSGDKRVDTEVKQDMLTHYFAKYSIAVVFDDRPSVIRMWRENGLEVIDVGKGIEF